jgi:patatin-like phospholipase/acyl hydrolase|tara:strand:+ start:145 stop:1014 length:870 start_codon:yes stop_codon:yes gene_type:complete
MTKYVLSLDGGGVRGLATSVFLYELEKKIGKPLSSKFDLVVGTSTGGIMALIISVLEIEGPRLLEIYSEKNLKKIFTRSFSSLFRTKYNGQKKMEVMYDYFGSLKMSSSDTPCSIVTYNLNTRFPEIFSERDHPEVSVADIAAATSAAPTYFPAVQIEDNWYVDGAVSTNNPALIALTEAEKLYPEDEIKVFSIGTGFNNSFIDGSKAKNWGSLSWLRGGIIPMLLESNLEHQLSETIIGNNYFRVDSNLNDVATQIDIKSMNNLERMREMGQKWWSKYMNASLDFLNE